jgi:hypothetical protein
MNLAFGDFEDGGPLAQIFGYVQGATLAAGGGIGGSTSLRTTTPMTDGFQNGGYLGYASTHPTGIMGVWSDFDVAGSGSSALIEVWQGDKFLQVRPVGTALEVWTVNGGVIFTASGAISAGTFKRIELRWTASSLTVSNSLEFNGSVVLRVNEVVVGSASGIQLGFPLPAGFTRDVYWNVVVFNPHGDGDKFYLNNGHGDYNNDYMPANVNIYTKRPLTGNGSFTELTPVTGTDQGAMVDDVLSDDDTTYVAGTGAAMKSSWNFDNFASIGSQVVRAMQHVAHGRKTESGFRRFRSFAYNGTTQQFAGTDHPIGVGHFAWMQHIWELNPYTNRPWTIDEINALEFGVLIG